VTGEDVTEPTSKSGINPGIYGRAFGWRISKTEKDSVSDVASSFVTLSQRDWIDVMEDYIAITRKRMKNRIAMARVQLHIAEDIMLAQGAVKHYRKKFDGLVAAEGTSQATDTAADKKLIEKEMFLHRAFANCFRIIGDGIAWRALGFDRAVLRALAGSAVKQQLLDEGTSNELHQFAKVFDTGEGFAILNALTNSLAIGDVTVIKNDGSLEAVEVKTTNADGARITRQKHRMREVSELIKNGAGKLEGQDVAIMKFDIPLDNNLADLKRLFEEATRSGYAGEMFHPWSYVEAFDTEGLVELGDEWKQAAGEKRKTMSSWADAKDLVMKTNSLDLLAFTPNCAPFSIFPFSDRTCAELVTSSKHYTTFLNLTKLGQEFERLGWKVEKGPEELMQGATRLTPMFRLRRDSMFGEVPPADVTRMQMELIQPHVFTRTLDAIFEKGPCGGTPPAGMVVYEGEKNLWV
jgi:hypothetical protein